MKQMTEQNLINAFGGESQAHMRYVQFAAKAQRETFANVARLFKAIAHAEYVHARVHYQELKHLKGGFVANSMAAFGPGDTKKNLELAIMGETFKITEMYPVYIQVADFQGEHGAKRSFEYAFHTEKEHKRLFEKAAAAIERGTDVDLGPIMVCEGCGYTIEGAVPDNCPLCHTPKDRFTAFI